MVIGRIVVLLLLIVAMAGGGLVWFDYLNLIDVKTTLAPLYRLIGREGRTQGAVQGDEFINLDAERLAVRLEALDLRSLEMERQEQTIAGRRGEVELMAQELEARQKALEDRENSFNAAVEEAETRLRNVEQNSRQLTGMPPQAAVAIIAAMNDQDAIDVLRMTDDIARREGSQSLVPYWMSLMQPERVAELQRKMTNRPESLE
jgi:flagellar protein FlbB